MNYTSDYLIDTILLNNNSYISEKKRKLIIKDIVLLQEMSEPFGIIKDTSIDKLDTVDTTSLVLIHAWQNELFAIKHFRECGKILPNKGFYETII